MIYKEIFLTATTNRILKDHDGAVAVCKLSPAVPKFDTVMPY